MEEIYVVSSQGNDQGWFGEAVAESSKVIPQACNTRYKKGGANSDDSSVSLKSLVVRI